MEKKIIKKKASIKTVKKETVKPAVAGEFVSRLSLNKLVPPRGSNDRKKLLGRGPGSGHGKTSTRGSKGQTSRAGRDMYIGFEGGQTPMIRRMPKRGFTSKFKKVYQILNLRDLLKIKETAITPELLVLKGIIKDKNKLIKVLGEGEVKHAITIKAHAFSKQAQEKLKNSGSTFEVLNA